ncbi:uncharacterized protein LOC111360937 [Spodoptera litura]|uniref:Uncharacterized protein LOC111360937 n=1 Tax=Spodoptera litura TaxID=69820 RepID=A0A9J7ERA4_SPOLT|nr:uncharacterized protein LOC111360937 [Spodoptera litura]
MLCGDMPAEAVATANLISDMDQLFDGVNASTPDLRRGKKFSTNIKRSTEHLQMFTKMKHFFSSLEFLGCKGNPPSKEGWIWTLNGIEMIWRTFSSKYKTVESLSTRRLQQDPLENLFGCIRYNCGSNNNPTVAQFVAGLKTAVISNIAHTNSGNCEADSNSAIITNFKTLLTPAPDLCTETEQCHMEKDIDENITSSLEENLEEGSGEVQACAYVCGFIIKKNKNNCSHCKKNFVSETPEEVHNFIEFKNYDDVKKSLTYASKSLIACVEKSASVINIFLEKEAYKEDIKKKAIQLLKDSINYGFLEDCVEHKNYNKMYIINSVFHIVVKRYCIQKNRFYAEESSKTALKRKMNIVMHK